MALLQGISFNYHMSLRHWEIPAFLKTEDGINIVMSILCRHLKWFGLKPSLTCWMSLTFCRSTWINMGFFMITDSYIWNASNLVWHLLKILEEPPSPKLEIFSHNQAILISLLRNVHYFHPVNSIRFIVFVTCGRYQVTAGHGDQGGAPLSRPESVPWRHSQARTNERVGPAPQSSPAVTSPKKVSISKQKGPGGLQIAVS